MIAIKERQTLTILSAFQDHTRIHRAITTKHSRDDAGYCES